MSRRVIVEIADHVATVTLNRADKRNAVDEEMFMALIDAADSIAANSGVRAVVLHGDGAHFCAGIDITVFETGALADDFDSKMQPSSASGANYFQRAATSWKDLPVPVIAALRGMVFGAGFQIAMGADIRIAAADVQMSIMEIKWGIIPDMGLSTTLPGVIPQDRARLLAYTGRILDGAAALDAGVITEQSDAPLAAAEALAAEIAAKSPDAIRAIKTLINTAWRDDPAPGFRLEAALQQRVMAGANQAEATRANLEKRPADFKDPE